MKRHWSLLGIILLASLHAAATQQPQKPDEKKNAPQISPMARLAGAKIALLKRAGSGSHIAYDVVSESLEGWQRFKLVNTQEKADIIIEIFSNED